MKWYWFLGIFCLLAIVTSILVYLFVYRKRNRNATTTPTPENNVLKNDTNDDDENGNKLDLHNNSWDVYPFTAKENTEVYQNRVQQWLLLREEIGYDEEEQNPYPMGLSLDDDIHIRLSLEGADDDQFGYEIWNQYHWRMVSAPGQQKVYLWYNNLPRGYIHQPEIQFGKTLTMPTANDLFISSDYHLFYYVWQEEQQEWNLCNCVLSWDTPTTIVLHVGKDYSLWTMDIQKEELMIRTPNLATTVVESLIVFAVFWDDIDQTMWLASNSGIRYWKKTKDGPWVEDGVWLPHCTFSSVIVVRMDYVEPLLICGEAHLNQVSIMPLHKPFEIREVIRIMDEEMGLFGNTLLWHAGNLYVSCPLENTFGGGIYVYKYIRGHWFPKAYFHDRLLGQFANAMSPGVWVGNCSGPGRVYLIEEKEKQLNALPIS